MNKKKKTPQTHSEDFLIMRGVENNQYGGQLNVRNNTIFINHLQGNAIIKCDFKVHFSNHVIEMLNKGVISFKLAKIGHAIGLMPGIGLEDRQHCEFYSVAKAIMNVLLHKDRESSKALGKSFEELVYIGLCCDAFESATERFSIKKCNNDSRIYDEKPLPFSRKELLDFLSNIPVLVYAAPIDQKLEQAARAFSKYNDFIVWRNYGDFTSKPKSYLKIQGSDLVFDGALKTELRFNHTLKIMTENKQITSCLQETLRNPPPPPQNTPQKPPKMRK